MIHRIATLVALGCLGFVAAPAAALQIDWAGTITTVLEDDGTSAELTGNGMGDGLSGSFVVGDTCAAGCGDTVEADETNYEFQLGSTFGALLTDGVDSVASTNAAVNVQNDHALDADEADLVSTLLGTEVSAGTTVDVYALAAATDDAVFDMNDELFDGVVVEVVLGSFDTSLFSDTSYPAGPPDLSQVDFAFFFVSDAASGVVTYEGIGTVDSLAVPEPGPAALLGLAAAGGLALRRRRD
jgi:hypothetical protein